jgi:5-methylthioadenosine/S-adenosylhomocysteine deaminase
LRQKAPAKSLNFIIDVLNWRPMANPSSSETSLIVPEWIAPVVPAGQVLRGHALAIRAGQIEAILPVAEAGARYPDAARQVLDGHLLIPGLVNLHTHAAMSLLRGIGDDLPLERWLRERIWPAESRLAGHDFVHDGSLLAAREMLLGGVTTFNDMYFFPEATAQAARALGMRVALGLIVIGFPSAWASTPADYLRKGLNLRDDLRGEERLSFCLAPHAPYTVDEDTLRQVAILANELELPVHIHVHETAAEVDDSIRQHGRRPLERLDVIGLVGPQLLAVHAVHLTPAEIDLLAERGASVAHCPHSNLKLASGIAPVAQLLKAGVNVGIGTDGSASNNRLDLLQEARTATLLAKAGAHDAATWPAHRVLHALTLGGAQALGLDGRIGSIEIGKCADLVAVDLSAAELSPVFDPVAQLVYAAGREHVSHVWIDGVPVVEKRQLVLRSAISACGEVLGRMAMWQNRVQVALEIPS